VAKLSIPVVAAAIVDRGAASAHAGPSQRDRLRKRVERGWAIDQRL